MAPPLSSRDRGRLSFRVQTGVTRSAAVRDEPRATVGRRSWEIWLLIGLSLPILFYGLASYSVVNGDEAFYHYVARQMVRSGDWLHLEFAGEARIYDTMMNAPLQYWMRAGAIALFGDSPWTMRGLSTLAALASVLMTFRLGRRIAGRGAGLVAALIQLTTYQFVYLHSARTGELEPALCLIFTVIAWLFLDGIEGRRGFLAHHLALMLLANLKLPLFALPLLAEALFFFCVRDARGAVRAYLRAAWLLPLGFVWHLWHLFTLGQPVREVLAQMVGEASGSAWIQQRSLSGNLRFHVRNLFSGAFPWSLLLLPGVVGLLLGKSISPGKKALTLVYPLAILLFFCAIAKSHPWYVMPIYPFLAIATAVGWPEFVVIRRRSATLAVGLLGAFAIWLEYRDANPFARRAVEQLAGPLSWRAFEAAAPWALPSTALLLMGLVSIGRRVFGERCAAGAMIGLLLLCAGWRVVVPLQWVDHRSQMETQRRLVDERRARGEALDLPIPIRESGEQLVRYYFADDFRIERASEGEVQFWLTEEGRTLGALPQATGR